MNPEPQAHAVDRPLCVSMDSMTTFFTSKPPGNSTLMNLQMNGFKEKVKHHFETKTSNIIQHVHFKFHIMFPQQNYCKNNVSKVSRHFLRLKFAPKKSPPSNGQSNPGSFLLLEIFKDLGFCTWAMGFGFGKAPPLKLNRLGSPPKTGWIWSRCGFPNFRIKRGIFRFGSHV